MLCLSLFFLGSGLAYSAWEKTGFVFYYYISSWRLWSLLAFPFYPWEGGHLFLSLGCGSFNLWMGFSSLISYGRNFVCFAFFFFMAVGQS